MRRYNSLRANAVLWTIDSFVTIRKTPPLKIGSYGRLWRVHLVITNKVVLALLAVLAVLTVVCTVLMGFQTLFTSLQDTAAASVLSWIGLGCVILLLADVLLLVAALAVRSVEQSSHDE